jgi:hypothetical protein
MHSFRTKNSKTKYCVPTSISQIWCLSWTLGSNSRVPLLCWGKNGVKLLHMQNACYFNTVINLYCMKNLFTYSPNRYALPSPSCIAQKSDPPSPYRCAKRIEFGRTLLPATNFRNLYVCKWRTHNENTGQGILQITYQSVLFFIVLAKQKNLALYDTPDTVLCSIQRMVH